MLQPSHSSSPSALSALHVPKDWPRNIHLAFHYTHASVSRFEGGTLAADPSADKTLRSGLCMWLALDRRIDDILSAKTVSDKLDHEVWLLARGSLTRYKCVAHTILQEQSQPQESYSMCTSRQPPLLSGSLLSLDIKPWTHFPLRPYSRSTIVPIHKPPSSIHCKRSIHKPPALTHQPLYYDTISRIPSTADIPLPNLESFYGIREPTRRGLTQGPHLTSERYAH